MNKFLETFGGRGGGGGGGGGRGGPGGGRPGGPGATRPGGPGANRPRRGPGSNLERLQLIANSRTGVRGVSPAARANARRAIRARQDRQVNRAIRARGG